VAGQELELEKVEEVVVPWDLGSAVAESVEMRLHEVKLPGQED